METERRNPLFEGLILYAAYERAARHRELDQTGQRPQRNTDECLHGEPARALSKPRQRSSYGKGGGSQVVFDKGRIASTEKVPFAGTAAIDAARTPNYSADRMRGARSLARAEWRTITRCR